jgi:signal transduction histidine kinase
MEESSDSAVAWLAVAMSTVSQPRVSTVSQPRVSTASQPRVPLSRSSCLSLARLVLAPLGSVGDLSGGQVHGSGGIGLAAGFRLSGGDDARVAGWLESVAAEPPESESRSGPLVAALQAALFVPHPAAAEAAVLADALAAAAARATLTARFDEAVAAARIEALREFAYGAGHEINNPLANIATRAQALLLDESDPERRRRLATIVDQAFRGRDMIGGLMVFARPPKPQPTVVSVDQVVRGVIESVQPLAVGRGLRLEYSPSPVSLDIHVDATLVAEALRLLVVNAVEAVGGSRVIVTAAATSDPVGGCEVTISDEGPGMPADVLRRAFDPFFSGREAGRGIGLGLPKAWRLVEINGGRLVIDSKPQRGTRIVVLLPGPPVTSPA